MVSEDLRSCLAPGMTPGYDLLESGILNFKLFANIYHILRKSEQSIEWLARSSSDKIGQFHASARASECSGLVVECLTIGRAIVCWSLTGVTMLCPLKQDALIFA